MKILHWSFVLIIIIIPVSILCRITVNSRFQALKDEVRINNALDTATQDAIDQIITVSNFDYDENYNNIINITPELAQEAINTFFHTFAVNYNIPFKVSDVTQNTQKSSDSYIKNYFSSYIPAVIVVAYDGFYVYSQESTSTGYEYQLSSKIPYTKKYSNYSIGYTLDRDVYLYYNNYCYSGKLYHNSFDSIRTKFYDKAEGFSHMIVGRTDMESVAKDISSITDDISMVLYVLNNCPTKASQVTKFKELIPGSGVNNFLLDYKSSFNIKDVQNSDLGEPILVADDTNIGAFNAERRTVIISKISDCLNETINVKHNRFAEMTGSTYNFYLPQISNDDWINSINDITVMSFVQGIPIGTLKGTYYNNYALGGSQIVNRNFLYGNTVQSAYSGNAVKLYHRNENCDGITKHNNLDAENKKIYNAIFITEEDAKNQGYLPCQLCN